MWCLATCQIWGLGSYFIFMGVFFLSKFNPDLNNTRKHKSKLYVGFSETDVGEWTPNIYLWYTQKLSCVVKCDAFTCLKCFWFTCGQIIQLNNFVWGSCVGCSLFATTTFFNAMNLYLEPFCLFTTCSRPWLRVIPLLIQSCASPLKKFTRCSL